MKATSGYKLILGAILIIMIALLWIPLNEVMGGSDGLTDIFNSEANDSEVIEYNNTANSIWYYTAFFFVIVIGLWVIKEEKPSMGVE